MSMSLLRRKVAPRKVAKKVALVVVCVVVVVYLRSSLKQVKNHRSLSYGPRKTNYQTNY